MNECTQRRERERERPGLPTYTGWDVTPLGPFVRSFLGILCSGGVQRVVTGFRMVQNASEVMSGHDSCPRKYRHEL